MKALSIRQPWAWLIVNGYKTVENRDWNTKYRGRFFVHASKKIDVIGYEWINKNFPEIELPDTFETGGIIGTARLINTVHESEFRYLASKDKPWFVGEYGFILDEGKPCELRPCRGQLYFFDVML